MAENALTKVAGIAIRAAMQAKVKDSDGNDKFINPTGPKNTLDFTGVTFGGDGNSGGGTTNTQSAGADYYAGSLADGEISQRKLEWSGTDNLSGTTVTFNDDPGTKFNGLFEGITIYGHMQKVAITKGVIGSTVNMRINYDKQNNVKAGYFTTMAPYPIYVKAESLAVGKKLEIPIAGIGEGLSGKNVKATKLYLTFNANKTMTIGHDMGYDNDGDSAGATGANYQFIVDTIASFSTQKAVSQLPTAINLFSGSARGTIPLAGLTEYFENSMDGIYVYFDDLITNYQAGSSSNGTFRVDGIGQPGGIIIKKEDLIVGNKIPIRFNSVGTKIIKYNTSPSTSLWEEDTYGPYYVGEVNDAYILIGEGNITYNMTFFAETKKSGNSYVDRSIQYVQNINRVTTFKNN